MTETRINGHMFESMMHHALACLISEEKHLNSLNVFPVADGDTGTNMRRTLENAMGMASHTPELNLYLQELSNGMLLSARGNSGVILSQLFKGIYLELARCSTAGVEEMRNAFVRAYRVAYDAVINPVEGTMLTVAREGIEHVKSFISRKTPINEFMEMYLDEMIDVLKKTPDLLPVLKESGVIDSGGMGYITIISGMLDFLNGKPMPDQGQHVSPIDSQNSPDLSLFTQDSVFEEGYCMEFILQRMKASTYEQAFDIGQYIDALQGMGESLVVVENDYRVKVHIHTKKPADIIAFSQRYGEFLTFKLENMQIQHMEYIAPKEPEKREYKPLVIVSVANGDGMRSIMLDQGSDYVIDGGRTMSVSAKEFIDLFSTINADEIVVFPNSSNVFLSAEQARTMCRERQDHIHIIHTSSMAEGYFAMAMNMPDEADTQKRIRGFKENANGVTTLTIARTIKNFTHDGVFFDAGKVTAFINGKPIAAGDAADEVLQMVFDSVPDLSEREACVILSGQNVDVEMTSSLEEIATNQMVFADICVLDGGQEVYDWIIGLI